MTHFLYCPFTGLGLRGGYRGDEWLKNRIRVFNQFVLPSILNQSNQNFYLWVSWRPEEETNPIVLDFANTLNQIRGLKFIFTFHGLCFWDDKYPDKEAEARLYNALSATLPDLKEFCEGEEVLMTIQPSDDMYLSNVVEAVQNKWPIKDIDVMCFEKGYIIDFGTKEIALYNPDTTPPFSTIKFQKDVFLDVNKHMDFTGPYKSHEYIGNKMRAGYWRDRGFVVGTHGENISTVYNHPYRGRVLSLNEREAVLIKTGNLFTDPVKLRLGKRLVARQILNVLPFQNSLRNAYHNLDPKWQIF